MDSVTSWFGALAATMASPDNAGLYLGLVSCVLLALVAGLLLTIGEQLKRMKADFRKAPLLAEDLASQLMQAREAMAQLQKAAKDAGPLLQPVLKESERVRQDLEFLTARAEKLAQRLEDDVRRDVQDEPVVALPVAAKVGPLLTAYRAPEEMTQVEVQNVKAVATVADERQPDLLEEILSTLHSQQVVGPRVNGAETSDNSERKTSSDEPVMRRVKARRTVSQAELDLREKLGQ